MSDRVRERAPGDPLAIGSGEWNVLARMGNEWAARRGRVGAESAADSPLTPAVLVWVRNDTGGPLPAFSPVRLGATLTGLAATPPDPFESRDRPCFAGLACDGGTSPTAVYQEAVPAGELGRAAALGVTVARVAAGLAAGSWAQPPASGNVELAAGGSFARLLTAATGSGDARALVVIGGGAVGLVPVRATAANSGGQWTAGTLLAFTTGGELANATPAETIDLKPLQGTLVNNEVYFAADTGRRSPPAGSPPVARRRFRTERAAAGLPANDPSNQGTVWRYQTVVTAINGVTVTCNDGQIQVNVDFATASVKVLV